MVALEGWLEILKLACCTLTALEANATKFVSPLYCATRVCEPPVRVAMTVATPEEFTGAAFPRALPLSVNVTVPVGTPADELSVAVSVAGCP